MLSDIIEVLEQSVDGDYVINDIKYQKCQYHRTPCQTILVTALEYKTQLCIHINTAVGTVDGVYLSYLYQLNLNDITNIKTSDQYFQRSTICDLSLITFEQLIKLNSVLNDIRGELYG